MLRIKRVLAIVVVVSLFFAIQCGYAAGTNDITTELKGIENKIRVKWLAGKKTEKDLAPELKQFDGLLAEHKGEKSDAVAKVLFDEATIYGLLLHDLDKSVALHERLEREFPDSPYVKQIRQDDARRLQKGLPVGKQFPNFEVNDLAGQPLSVTNYKGKVVLVDFWATWCGPCCGEMPNVLKVYRKHHAQGLEIIGISLDQNKGKLESYVKQHGIPWPQYFDGRGWKNKLAVKYGIRAIPANYLLDTNGVIINKDLRGWELEKAVAAAVERKESR